MAIVKVAVWQVWVCSRCGCILKNVPTLNVNIREHLWLDHDRLIEPAIAASEGRVMEDLTVMIKP